MRVVVILVVVSLSVIGPEVLAQWPEVTMHHIQFVEDPDDSADMSPIAWDTLVVEGVVMDDARSLWCGPRWSMLIAVPDGGPWSGLQIVQYDTLESGTNLLAVESGMTAKFTGFVEEFSYAPRVRGATRLALLTDPPVAVQFTGTAALPEPEIVTCEDLSSIPLGEQWEDVLIQIENAVMINNNLPGGQALIEDDTGYQLVVEDWYNSLRDSLAAGLYQWPDIGSYFTITGSVSDLSSGTGYAIAPRSSGDIDLGIELNAMVLDIKLIDASMCQITWTAVIGATYYDLYRSTASFFNPSGQPWLTVVAPTTYANTASGIGDTETNYFFVGIARNAFQLSPESNIVGEFDYEAEIP